MKKDIKSLQGKRLDELIQRKYNTLPPRSRRNAFIEDLQLQGSNIDKEMISMYINGKKSLSDRVIELFSYILDVDMDYLDGDIRDCESYAEYETLKNITSKGSKYSRERRLLNNLGYFVMMATDATFTHQTSDITTIGVSRSSEDGIISKRFTPEELQQFYQAVISFTNKYFDEFIETDPDDLTPEEIEKIRQATTSRESREGSEEGQAPDDKQSIKRKAENENE